MLLKKMSLRVPTMPNRHANPTSTRNPPLSLTLMARVCHWCVVVRETASQRRDGARAECYGILSEEDASPGRCSEWSAVCVAAAQGAIALLAHGGETLTALV